jgi:hypothetical protein
MCRVAASQGNIQNQIFSGWSLYTFLASYSRRLEEESYLVDSTEDDKELAQPVLKAARDLGRNKFIMKLTYIDSTRSGSAYRYHDFWSGHMLEEMVNLLEEHLAELAYDMEMLERKLRKTSSDPKAIPEFWKPFFEKGAQEFWPPGRSIADADHRVRKEQRSREASNSNNQPAEGKQPDTRSRYRRKLDQEKYDKEHGILTWPESSSEDERQIPVHQGARRDVNIVGRPEHTAQKASMWTPTSGSAVRQPERRTFAEQAAEINMRPSIDLQSRSSKGSFDGVVERGSRQHVPPSQTVRGINRPATPRPPSTSHSSRQTRTSVHGKPSSSKRER